MFSMDSPAEIERMGLSRADKKRLKLRSEKVKQLGVMGLIANVIYLGTLSYQLSAGTLDYDSFPLYSFMLYPSAAAFLAWNILNSVSDGLNYEYYFDLYVLTLVAQDLSLVTEYANYLFLVVPLVLLWSVWGWVKPFIFPGAGIEIPVDPKEQAKIDKRETKKEAKQQRRKMVFK